MEAGDRGVRGPGPAVVARGMRHRTGFVFLESVVGNSSSISLLAADPDTVVSGGPGDWDALESALEARRSTLRREGPAGGAAVGWLGFDGQFCFGFYGQPHVYDHGTRTWRTPPPPATAAGRVSPTPVRFTPLVAKEQFLDMVARAQEYIAAGDIYQVCLAHPFVTGDPCDPFAYYEALRTASPAPHAAYLDLGGRRIASASPELFLRMDDRSITTCPIKGTRPRHADPARDALSARSLLESPKEAAELVMITDLERNDLGRICAYASVHVTSLLALHRFRQVHHLASTIRGTLRAGVTHATALRLCSPGGSISGAPKSRALEIIAELEPFPRGLYTGAIGYFGFDGQSQFSIAIRTAVFGDGRGEFSVGAGIVADSVAEDEWVETMHKAAGLIEAAGAPAN
jgi:para-aminobenzoate synthetase component I